MIYEYRLCSAKDGDRHLTPPSLPGALLADIPVPPLAAVLVK